MTIDDFRKIVYHSFDVISDPVIRYAAREASLQLFAEELTQNAWEEVLPQRQNSVAVVVERPKSAALFFDRVFHIRDPYSVPTAILVKVPSSIFLYDMFLSRLLNYADCLEKRLDPDLPGNKLANGITKAAIILGDHIVPGFASAQIRSSDILDWGQKVYRNLLELHCGALWHEYGVCSFPIYGSYESFEKAYSEGDQIAVLGFLSNLGVVDEKHLKWEQVVDFRNDKKSLAKIRRLLHWFDASYEGRSRAFIEDDLCSKIEDYRDALKRHGIKSVVGTISSVLDGKFVFGSAAAAVGITYATNSPVLGILTEGLLLSGKVLVHISEELIDFQDLRGGMKEIAFIHDLSRNFGIRQKYGLTNGSA